MTAFIVIASVLGFLTAWVLHTRHWYGSWRIVEQEKRDGVREKSYGEKLVSDLELAGWATVSGLFWWLTGPVYLWRWLIMSRQPRAPHEVAAVQKAKEAERKTITLALEKENGMLREDQEQ